MSSIRYQSVLSSILIYAGFLIGAFNILVLFPNQRHFSTEEFGLTRLLLDIAILFSTACTLGSLNLSFKFYPFHRHYLPHERNDLLAIGLLLTTLGCILFVAVMSLAEGFMLRKFGGRSPLFVEYSYLIYPFTVTMAFFHLMEAYAWSLQRTVLSNFLKEFLSRLLVTLLILLYTNGIVSSFRGFANLYSLTYGFLALVLFIVFIRKGEIPFPTRISHVTRRLWPQMATFGISFFLSAMLHILARTNDTIILASQSKGGLADTAVFVIATYLVTLIDVPQRGMLSAATAQISKAWRDRDVARIGRLYQKTALNLLIAGTAILCILLLNVESLATYLGPTYGAVPYLTLVLGLSRLIDLGTGLNSQILVLSKHWKTDLLLNLFYVAASILLNYLLTVRLGVMGPAWGGLIAIILFNSIRFILLRRLYRLQPFSLRNLYVLLLGGLAFLAALAIPTLGNMYADVIIRSSLFLALYIGGVVGFKLSEDIAMVLTDIRARLLRMRGQ